MLRLTISDFIAEQETQLLSGVIVEIARMVVSNRKDMPSIFSRLKIASKCCTSRNPT